jgi:hypothetical protein
MGTWLRVRQPRVESQVPLQRLVLRTPVTGNLIKRSAAISPDGKQIAFVHGEWIQHLDQEQPKGVEGSEGATNLFWSPDSKGVGFGAPFDSSAAQGRGSGGFCAELRIPPPEHVLQLVTQDLGSGLQQQVPATERLVHLLLLDEAPAHHLIDR